MDGILESLYYGKCNPEEHIRPRNPEYSKINRRISDCMDICSDRFSKEDFGLLEEVLDLLGQANAMEAAASFSQGFTMGALVMMEVLGGMERAKA